MFNWCVSFCLETTFCVVSRVLLVPLRRDAVSCLAASCPIKQQSRSVFPKRRQGPEDALWWRAHRNQGNANGERFNQSNSILEPCHINLRTTRKTIVRAKQRFPSKKQEKQRSSTHKLLNNSATPTAETTLQSDICGNKKHTPGKTCSHKLKPLLARRLPVQERQHLPRCCGRDSVR